MKVDQMSMIEVAESLMLQKKKPQSIRNLIKEVIEMKGIDANDADKIAQLYIDITTSAKFVYCGEDTWDLKERQSLELWDRDGSYFNSEVVEEDDDDDLTLDDYSLEEEKEDDDDDETSEEEVVDDEILVEENDDDDDEVDFLDEEKYNTMMDDYEDLYEDK